MNVLLRRKAALLAGLVAVGGWAAPALANSQVADQGARPGSFQAIMSTKSPGTFGQPLLAANEEPATPGASSKPGSFESIMSTKSPGTFGPHLAAANAPETRVAGNGCRPGSFAAIMSAKLPPNARPGNPEMYKDCR
ncbi:MAG: hypothetical protein P4L83_14580 [Nevskia sp.]|nr:hypothetical protein [Nevskia sp.]